MKGYRHIEYNDRLQIEVMFKLGCSTQMIADKLGFSYVTIYREKKRGQCTQIDSELRMYSAYSADVAQKDYNRKASHKGASLKIGRDHKLAQFIEDQILIGKCSPAVVAEKIKEKKDDFTVTLCEATIYRYIDDDIFLNVTNKNLVYGKRSHKKYKKVQRISYKQPLNKNIDQRPPEIAQRSEFGHWEMDTVVGKAKGKSTCLLVLTERKTRYEIVMKMQQRTTEQVRYCIDRLNRKCKQQFSTIFKTITVDNGSEFMDAEGIERNGRTTVYYCHPFSSWERGSNENNNKLIRRFIPKGTNIEKYSQKEIERIEHWMNHYPRKMFGFKTSDQLFQKEIQQLMAA